MKDKNHDTSNCISLMKRIKDVPVIEEKREKSGGGRGVWKVDVWAELYGISSGGREK